MEFEEPRAEPPRFLAGPYGRRRCRGGPSSSSRPGRAGGGWAPPGPGSASRYHEGARYRPRPQLEFQRRVLSAPGLQDAGWKRGPRSLSLACGGRLAPHPRSRCRAPPARGRRGGRDWVRSEAGRDLEKPPRLHCSGRGRPEEPVPLSRRPAGVRGARFPGAWPCLAGTRDSVRAGPRPADPSACDHLEEGQRRAADSGRDSGYDRSGSPAPPVVWGLWYSD